MCELIVFFVVRGLLIYLDIDLKVDSRTFFLLWIDSNDFESSLSNFKSILIKYKSSLINFKANLINLKSSLVNFKLILMIFKSNLGNFKLIPMSFKSTLINL